ncbi:MAG: hypothetical protein HY046_01950 [Acidobacteria bacterium]|nr:hypothetical protein [Acidobacteriota bacterium]
MAARPRRKKTATARESLEWIHTLAEPYLRGYFPVLQSRGNFRGYWFLADPKSQPPDLSSGSKSTSRRKATSGFFVGYLQESKGNLYLNPLPPECLVFVFVTPVGGTAHKRLVSNDDGLIRNTFTYIRYLTHHLPRFEFYERQLAAMVRHHSMRKWPVGKRKHLSRNFFIETLAWLVRSALVRKLPSAVRTRS